MVIYAYRNNSGVCALFCVIVWKQQDLGISVLDMKDTAHKMCNIFLYDVLHEMFLFG
jgi:hypothetical protein